MYAALVAGWMADRGHRVAMVTRGGSPIAGDCQARGIEVIEANRAGYFWLPMVGVIAKGMRRCRPDVIHAHLSRDLWGIAMARIFGGKVPVVFSQQMASSYPKRDVLHRSVWGMVSRVAALTEEIREKTIQNAPIAADRVCVLPYGIDTDEMMPMPDKRQALRRQHGIGDDVFVVGIVGRLDPGKGQEVFLEALSRLTKRQGIFGLLIGEETRGEAGYKKVL